LGIDIQNLRSDLSGGEGGKGEGGREKERER